MQAGPKPPSLDTGDLMQARPKPASLDGGNLMQARPKPPSLDTGDLMQARLKPASLDAVIYDSTHGSLKNIVLSKALQWGSKPYSRILKEYYALIILLTPRGEGGGSPQPWLANALEALNQERG